MAEPFLAEVRMVGFNFAPRGWALCDGQLLPINQHQSLYSILGTTYGGDGRTTFALPDLRGRAPTHPGSYGITLGYKGGVESVTLTAATLPNHTHTIDTVAGPAVTTDPADNLPAVAQEDSFGHSSGGGNQVSLGSSSVSPSGGNQSHTNLQPFLVVTFIIALQGLFPSRN